MIEAIIILGLMAAFFGIVLGLAKKEFSVDEDPKVKEIYGALPHMDCGACGYPGCMQYAKAIANGAKGDLCKPGGQAALEKISKITGKSGKSVKMTARVHCHGGINASDSSDYHGPKTCLASSVIDSFKRCKEGCLGFGDCVNACRFGALSIVEGYPKIDPAVCTACGACVSACPKRLFTLLPIEKRVWIGCFSHDKAKAAKCKTGCIGCGICAKECPEGAIKMVESLPVIDYGKCTSCMACVRKCPRKIIKSI